LREKQISRSKWAKSSISETSEERGLDKSEKGGGQKIGRGEVFDS